MINQKETSKTTMTLQCKGHPMEVLNHTNI